MSDERRRAEDGSERVAEQSGRPRVSVVISDSLHSAEIALEAQERLFPHTNPGLSQRDGLWHVRREVLPGEEWMYADEIRGTARES